VLSELMPPRSRTAPACRGNRWAADSPWAQLPEAIARRRQKEFIRTLFLDPLWSRRRCPRTGADRQGGAETRAVEKVLREIGSAYAHRIDLL
jgi:hypothetical protein